LQQQGDHSVVQSPFLQSHIPKPHRPRPRSSSSSREAPAAAVAATAGEGERFGVTLRRSWKMQLRVEAVLVLSLTAATILTRRLAHFAAAQLVILPTMHTHATLFTTTALTTPCLSVCCQPSAGQVAGGDTALIFRSGN
jgi:hypothetical protein